MFPACQEGEDVSGLSTPAPRESLPQSWGGFTLKCSCDVKPADVKDIGGPLKHPARIFHGDSHSSGSRQEKNGLCLPERTRFHYEVKPRQALCTCQPVLGFPSDFTLS